MATQGNPFWTDEEVQFVTHLQARVSTRTIW